MSLAPDPLLSVIGDAACVGHFVTGQGTPAERHAGNRFDFSETVLRKLPSDHWHRLVARLPPVCHKSTQVVLSPAGPGTVLGESVAKCLGVPFVRAFGRDGNCELVESQDSEKLCGRTCLMVDMCGDTMATLAGLETTARLCGAKVCAALILLIIQRVVDGQKTPTLPLNFAVVSYAMRIREIWTPEQCPSCYQRLVANGAYHARA